MVALAVLAKKEMAPVVQLHGVTITGSLAVQADKAALADKGAETAVPQMMPVP